MKNFKCWPKFNPRSLNYPEIPIFQILRSTAAKLPFRIAIIFDSLEITYSELLTLCERFANALAGLGGQKRGSGGHPPSQLAAVCHRLLCDPDERRNFHSLQSSDGGKGDGTPTQRRGGGNHHYPGSFLPDGGQGRSKDQTQKRNRGRDPRYISAPFDGHQTPAGEERTSRDPGFHLPSESA